MLTSAHRKRKAALAVALLAGLAVTSTTLATNGGGPNWGMQGNVSANTRNQPFERDISPTNVSHLALKWWAPTAGDVSATPAVVDGAVYFGDFGGTEWKLDAETGQVVWKHKVSDYTGIAGDISRTSPSVAGNTLIIGSLMRPIMLGIDTKTGDLRWKTQVHPDLQAAGHGIMTGSPVLAGDTIYTGVSASGAGGAGATFRGAIVALNAQTGKILWLSYSLPDNGGLPGGYAGSTMFGAPTVDLPDGLVYGAFGQPYTEPAIVTACHAAHGGFTESCEHLYPGVYLKSIVAFDLKTGEPQWSYRVQGHDAWQRACGSQPPTVTWCAPESDGEKWDIGGSPPNVMRIQMDGHWRNVVGVGEKSGVYYLFDVKSGELLWNTLLGPGGDQGGMEWGTAFDGDRIYASITNQHHISYKLTENGVLTSTTVTGGSWAALDPTTGEILWQTADPTVATRPGFATPVGVWDLAPVTVANGLVYASSMAKKTEGDDMYALDAATGEILWRFNAGSSVNSGPSVVDGTVYWGSGYSRSGAEGSGNTKLFAFSLDGK